MATLVNSSDIAPCSPEAPFGCSLAYVNLSSSICPGSLVNASSPCYSCRMQTAQEQKEFLGNLTQVLGSNSAATCATSGGATSAASRRVTMPSSWFLLVALLLFSSGAASAKEVALVPDKVLKKSSYQDVDGRILLTNPSDCGPVNQPQERVCSFDVYSDPNCQNAISGAYFSMNPNIGHNCGACLPWSMCVRRERCRIPLGAKTDLEHRRLPWRLGTLHHQPCRAAYRNCVNLSVSKRRRLCQGHRHRCHVRHRVQ